MGLEEVVGYMRKKHPLYEKLHDAGIVEVVPHPQKRFVVRVNFSRYKELFPEGRKMLHDFLRRIDGEHPLELPSPGKLGNLEEEIERRKDALENPYALRSLQEEGLVEIRDGRVRADELRRLVQSVRPKEKRLEYLRIVNGIDGVPAVVAELYLRDQAEKIWEGIYKAKAEIGKEEIDEKASRIEEKLRSLLEMKDVVFVPPKEFKIDEITPHGRVLKALNLLAKLAEEGKIDEETLRAIVERFDHGKLVQVLSEHVTGKGRYPPKTLTEMILKLLKKHADLETGKEQVAMVARAIRRCPRCGAPLRGKKKGLWCPRCRALYEDREPKTAREADEEDLRYEREFRLFQERYPHLLPLFVVEYRGKKVVALNPFHPLVKIIKEGRVTS